MAIGVKLLDRLSPNRRHLRSVGRGIGLAAVVGVIAGCGAIAFHFLCLVVVHGALVWAVGYDQGGPAGEVSLFAHGGGGTLRPWLFLVVPAMGGLVSGWLVYKFAPEAEGHGTDAAIDAYHRKRGLIRARVPIVKMFSSAITLGTGGSGGREGPIAQIGAGFGSFLATRLKLSDAERRILMAAGLGAGIGAIFHAPLAGAIFAIEVLYRDPDFEAEALIPALIATTIAYCTFNVLLHVTVGFDGFGHLFSVSPDIYFRDPLLLGPLTGLAVVMAGASYLYVRCFYGVNWMFRKMALRQWLKPAVGALAAGAVALMFYYSLSSFGPTARHDSLSILSFGYGFLQKLLDSPTGAGLTVTLLLVVGLGKIVTTSLTIGSGGSGGVFGPSMVIGGSLGALMGLLFQKLMPGVVTRIDVFVILGMAGFFAAAAKTPISTLIMVSEMTGSYELLLPSMWVCALAYLMSRGWTIFHNQVNTRLDSPAHRGDFLIDVLHGMRVADVLRPEARRFTSVRYDTPLREVVTLITGTKQSSFPVVDEDGRYRGLFSLNDVRQHLYDSPIGDLAVADDLAVAAGEPLVLDTDLGDTIGRFAELPFEELPVVDAGHPEYVIAMLRRQDVISAYNARLLEVRTSAANDG